MKTNNISREDIERLDKYVKEVSKGNSHIGALYEKKLIKEYRKEAGKKKDKILEELISYNITILAEIALNVINSMKGGDRIDPLDLMQIGIITFIKKLKTWDETKKAKMITYYYRDVKTQMQRFIMNNAFQVRQGSVFLQYLAYSISRITQRYLADEERIPNSLELATELGVAENTIKYCLRITSIQTLAIEENWVMFKANHAEQEYSLPPIYVVTSDLLKRLKGFQSESLLFELLDYFEKKQTLSLSTLQLLRESYNKQRFI